MADASLDDTAADRPRPVYPFPDLPARAQRLPVAPGVHGSHAAAAPAEPHQPVDAGLRRWRLCHRRHRSRTEEAAAVWHDLFAALPRGQAPTRRRHHMHPDHVGMAGWITRKFNARLWMTRLEYLTCRVMVAMGEAPGDATAFLMAVLGWGEDAIESYRVRFGKLRHPHPRPARELPPPERRRRAGHRRPQLA